MKNRSGFLSVRELVIFAMLGALMYASKVLMEFLPNIHIVGVLIVAITVVFRKKALYPLYIYVLLTGFFSGFATWWIPYLYIWTVLWAMVMLIPQKLSNKIKTPLYMVVCGLHGLLYGILYAPVQALIFGFGLDATISWILAGLPWDILHAIGNFFGGLLIMPIVYTLERANGKRKNK